MHRAIQLRARRFVMGEAALVAQEEVRPSLAQAKSLLSPSSNRQVDPG